MNEVLADDMEAAEYGDNNSKLRKRVTINEMADKHPYLSGSAGLVATINQLRNSFPNEVTAETLRKLSIAPKNEAYVINTLRFLGLLDEKGKKVTPVSNIFLAHEDEVFQPEFAKLVKAAYKELFDLHQEAAWALPTAKLIGFFRATDSTSSIVGQRQASAFQTLASLSGKGPAIVTKVTKQNTSKTTSKNSAPTQTKPKVKSETAHVNFEQPNQGNGKVALTVRIEVNLPVASDQKTYDLIFKSIREHLING